MKTPALDLPPTGCPPPDCQLCPRLAGFRAKARAKYPDWHNAPVMPFGPVDAGLLIVGLAPGLQGANRTGRPFTGDYAGDLLYATLLEFGLARGVYERRPDDSLELVDCRISNAVKCVPPENKPTPEEIRICNRFLKSELAALPRVKVVLALGSIAHDAVLVGSGLKKSAARFGHGARHDLPAGRVLFDSYHCSRYNTNTNRLTPAMFRDVVGKAKAALGR
ncbi:MAG TPA: uracil-DNA glycosylase [Alphaproteobacteria bacterium]|nr:uracil-DNA glycosylase [Alphaproteobacteria bacterium]